MKPSTLLLAGIVVLVASLAVACDSKDAPSGGEAVTGGGGLVRPNTFMTYEGRRYELVNMLFESMVAANEFQPVGEVTQADLDLTDTRVFQRSGDTTAVYTYSPPTAGDAGIWLAWRATS